MKKNKIVHEVLYILGFTVVICLLLFFSVFLSRQKWCNGLKVIVEKQIEEEFGKTYIVDSYLRINSPFSVSSGVFSLKKTALHAPNEISYAVIIKATGLCGAVPLIFIFDGTETFFVQRNKMTELRHQGITDKVIYFWQKRAEKLLPFDEEV